MKISIGIPCNRQFKPKTVISLMQMVNYSKLEYHFAISTKGYTVAENRNWIVAQALKNGCTHLLLTDDDMVYEKDTLERLLARKKDVIGVNYNVRRPTDEFTLVIEYLDDVKPKENEPFKCKAIGGGMLLVDLSILKKVGRPYFSYDVNKDGAITMSNDWYFCRQIRKAGYDIWCDPTIPVKHIGNYLY